VCEHLFVRWDNLRMDGEEERRLPGYSDSAVVRRFDAPEAMGVNFYEVRAKSALNRVPEKSYVPFRWTINPYRGCTHACTFCAAGDTRILMADGHTKPLADLRAGDWIYGTERRAAYRHYVATEVLDHWQTVKPAFRTTLEDGTELVTSGDHRFLTSRGWKYVHGLTNDNLVGTGQFAREPEDTPDYRRGYLCGVVRGDAVAGLYSQQASDDHHRFRLASADFEGVHRARRYLAAQGAVAVRERIRELIEWPRRASDDWGKGYLAGIFDAQGSYACGILRICNTDREIIDWITWCLRRFGFDHVVEQARADNGMQAVRVRGGLRAHLRFFHTTDPAISRKRTIDGQAMKSPTRLRVESVEPLGIEMPLYDITTGTGDFISNGVVSHNCFARPTHEFLDLNAREDFDKQIVVKVNLPEVLRAELGRPSWKGEHVALGTNTDPYQWVEKRYGLTRGVWEAMRDFANPCSVLTKSPLLLRDLDLFKQIAEVAPFTANLSIPTIDEKIWRQTEPHTPNPRARIEAVAELSRAGIPVGVLVAPLMPGVNDDPEQVEQIVQMCVDAGATNIGGICLHLRGEVKEIWFDWLRTYRPDLIPRYEKLYGRRAYATPAERERIARLVRVRAPEQVAALRENRRLMRGPLRAADDGATQARPERGAPAKQESLF
jgi:DNA repair photolyase